MTRRDEIVPRATPARGAVLRLVFAVASAATLLSDPPSAESGDAKSDQLRADIAALVAWVPAGEYSTVPDAPSPTALAARIAAAGDAKLRAELKTLWRLATTEGAPAEQRRPAIEETVRFLYGTADPKEPALRSVEGAILPFVPKRGEYDFGGFDRTEPKAGPPAFDVLVKGGKLRAAPKPQAAKLLEALGKSEVAGWGACAQQALGRAAGEGCSGAAVAKLVALAAQNPTDAMLSTALAWSAAPEAEAELRARVASLAPRVAEGKEAAAPLLAAATQGLAHVNAPALAEELDKLDAAARRAAVGGAGTSIALRYVLGRAEKSGAEGRAEALDLVRAVVGEGNSDASPEDGPKLVRFLADLAGDPSLGPAALETAETLLYAFNRYPVADAEMSSGGVDIKNDGGRIGPYPSIGPVLAAIAADLASGAAVFRSPADSLWDEPALRVAGEAGMASSSVKSPYPMSADGGGGAQVAVAGEIIAEGLRVTLTNRGKAAFALAAPSLRWGTGEVVAATIREGSKTRQFRCIRLQMGFVRASIAVPAEKCVTVAPGASHTWTIPLRDEDRGVDHVAVEVMGLVDVVGKPAAPLFEGFWQTWIK